MEKQIYPVPSLPEHIIQNYTPAFKETVGLEHSNTLEYRYMNIEGNWGQSRENCSQKMAFQTSVERTMQSGQATAL